MSILETTCYFVKGVPDGIREPLCLILLLTPPQVSTVCVYLFGEDKASLPVIDKSHRNMCGVSKQTRRKNDIHMKNE